MSTLPHFRLCESVSFVLSERLHKKFQKTKVPMTFRNENHGDFFYIKTSHPTQQKRSLFPVCDQKWKILKRPSNRNRHFVCQKFRDSYFRASEPLKPKHQKFRKQKNFLRHNWWAQSDQTASLSASFCSFFFQTKKKRKQLKLSRNKKGTANRSFLFTL